MTHQLLKIADAALFTGLVLTGAFKATNVGYVFVLLSFQRKK